MKDRYIPNSIFCKFKIGVVFQCLERLKSPDVYLEYVKSSLAFLAKFLKEIKTNNNFFSNKKQCVVGKPKDFLEGYGGFVT